MSTHDCVKDAAEVADYDHLGLRWRQCTRSLCDRLRQSLPAKKYGSSEFEHIADQTTSLVASVLAIFVERFDVIKCEFYPCVLLSQIVLAFDKG